MKLIIIPDWTEDSYSWQQIIDLLSPEYDVQAIDLPGFGDEGFISMSWGAAEYYQWLDGYITLHGWRDIVLLGHGFGGKIVIEAAVRPPSWLRGIILYGVPAVAISKPATVAQLQPRQTLLERIKEIFTGKKYTDNTQPAEHQMTEIEQLVQRIMNADQTTALKQITLPTRLIWGESDQQVPLVAGQEIAAMVAGSQLAILPKCENNVHIFNPELLTGLLRKLLREVS